VKEKIIYIISFLLAFVLITGLLIFLNSSYKNIFAFDFTPISRSVAEVKKQEPQNQSAVQPKDTTPLSAALKDTAVQKIDSSKIKPNLTAIKDSSAVKKVTQEKAKKVEPLPVNTAVVKTEPQKAVEIDKNNAKQDSVYKSWVKNTVKLYETMDTRKAAKIIQGYSDNIARDLLLTMKKKKAAEILAEFNPQTATRIISVTQ
jgi:flagellar motility protein MotE (MotC chaperone)